MGFMMGWDLILSFGASCRGGGQDNDFPDTTRSKWYKFENLAITRPFFANANCDSIASQDSCAYTVICFLQPTMCLLAVFRPNLIH